MEPYLGGVVDAKVLCSVLHMGMLSWFLHYYVTVLYI